MLNIGIGNAGSKILLAIHDATFPKEMVQVTPDLNALRFMVGDADSNNSVIYGIQHVKELDKLPAPKGVRVLRLDRFWSGGCGVYHTIGELLTDTAEEKHVLTGEIDSFAGGEHVNIFISAGGGTGGGVGGRLAEKLAEHPTRNVRVFAVLPETDQFSDGCTKISGPDSFQCASAGRFLAKAFGRRFRADLSDGNPGQQKSDCSDLFMLSNSYLTCIPSGVPFKEAVERINRYLFNVLMLMPSIAEYGARQRLVTFGQSWSLWPPVSGAADIATLGRYLVRSALQPLNLGKEASQGLSALPMDLTNYASHLEALLPEKADAELSGAAGVLRPEAHAECPDEGVDAELLGAAGVLRRLFRKSAAVDAWVHVREGIPYADRENLLQSVRAQLYHVFGPRVNSVNLAAAPLPSSVKPSNSAVTLLLLIDQMVVEEAYRLVMYYIQTAFPWTGGKVEAVAKKLDNLLIRRSVPLPDNDADSDTDKDYIRFELSQPGLTRLSSNAREVYTQHFWGNVDDLRNKVLQSLDKPEQDYDAKLLRTGDIADALWFFRGQIHRNMNGMDE